jgi:hypothetical protein
VKEPFKHKSYAKTGHPNKDNDSDKSAEAPRVLRPNDREQNSGTDPNQYVDGQSNSDGEAYKQAKKLRPLDPIMDNGQPHRHESDDSHQRPQAELHAVAMVGHQTQSLLSPAIIPSPDVG